MPNKCLLKSSEVRREGEEGKEMREKEGKLARNYRWDFYNEWEFRRE